MSTRILILSHKFYPDIGGIEANSEVLAEAFADAGHEVKVVTWSAEASLRSFSYDIIRKPTVSALVKAHLWAEIIFENNPCLRLSWVRFFISRPSVIALNTWICRPDGNINLQDKLKLKWLALSDKVIAVSEALKHRTYKDAIVIGNPYKVKAFRIIPEVIKNRDFVCLGRLVSDKGIDQAVYALHRLNQFCATENGLVRRFTLTVIGDGPEREMLEKLVQNLDMVHHVHFTGALTGKELTVCLNNHRFIIVPSVWEEPFGNVALEGMACGCLPIVSDGGGLPSAVGKAGLIYPRGNIDALVTFMKMIVSDPERETLIRKNFDSHLANHHPEVVADKYLQVFQSILKD